MIYCLDTDILIEYFKGDEKLKEKIEGLAEDDMLAITWFSFFEFFKGIFVAEKFEEEKFLKEILESVQVLGESYNSARIGGEIYAQLKKQGVLLNDADILIASIVKAHNAILITNNEDHFSRIEGLKIENWLKADE